MEQDLKFPIGKFQWVETLTTDERTNCIGVIEGAPAQLAAAVANLSAEQLDTSYRDGSWTVRQVVHHLADNDMGAFARCKFALTEEEPTIKTYKEKLWAELPDGKIAPIEPSLAIFENVHKRWGILLRSLSESDWAKKLVHPARGIMTVDCNVALYSWHARHHIAHITSLRERKGWK